MKYYVVVQVKAASFIIPTVEMELFEWPHSRKHSICVFILPYFVSAKLLLVRFVEALNWTRGESKVWRRRKKPCTQTFKNYMENKALIKLRKKLTGKPTTVKTNHAFISYTWKKWKILMLFCSCYNCYCSCFQYCLSSSYRTKLSSVFSVLLFWTVTKFLLCT